MSDRPDMGAIQRGVASLASTALASRLLSAVLPTLDNLLLRWSRGQASLTRAITGLPVVQLVLEDPGEGRRRCVPLLAIPHPKGVAVIGSNWGHSRPPSWAGRLRTKKTVGVKTKDGDYRATVTELSDVGYQTVWERAVELYPGFEHYRKRAGERHIPIFLLALEATR